MSIGRAASGVRVRRPIAVSTPRTKRFERDRLERRRHLGGDVEKRRPGDAVAPGGVS